MALFISCMVTSQSRSCTPLLPEAVSWWRGEQNSEDTLGLNHIQFMGGRYDTGKVGHALCFNGQKGEDAKVPLSPSLNSFRDAISWEFWVKPDPTNNMSSCCQGVISADYYNVEISGGYDVRIGLNWGINGGSKHASDGNGGGFLLTKGEWQHVAAVYDRINMAVYINGEVKAIVAYSEQIRSMTNTAFLTFGSEDGRGAVCLGCVGSRYFHGCLDEITLYSKNLNAAEVKKIYDAGNAGKCGPSGPPTKIPTSSPTLSTSPTTVSPTVSPTSFPTDNQITATPTMATTSDAGTTGPPTKSNHTTSTSPITSTTTATTSDAGTGPPTKSTQTTSTSSDNPIMSAPTTATTSDAGPTGSPTKSTQTTSTSSEQSSSIAVIVVTIVLTSVIIGLVVYIRRLRSKKKNRLQLGVSPQLVAVEVAKKVFTSSPTTSTTATASASPNAVTSNSNYSELTPHHKTYESNPTTAVSTDTQYEIPRMANDYYTNLT